MKKTLSFLLVLTLAPFIFADAKADAIAQKSYGLPNPKDSSMVATMTITDKSGTKKIRKLEMQGMDNGTVTSTFTKFLEPADVAGTKFLSTSTKGGEDDQRIYLPALKKVRKIASSGKDGDFVNSDLSYYDLENRDYEDGTYTFIAEGQTLPQFPGQTFNKIQIVSKDKSSPYSKSIAWIDAANSFIYKIEVYGKDGSLWKTITFNKVDNVKGYWIPMQTLVMNHKKGSNTSLVVSSVKVNTGLSPAVFSEKNLEN